MNVSGDDLPIPIDVGRGIGAINFANNYAFVAGGSDLSKSEKPVYLSLMMDIHQLQTIIDNKHLFDIALVNAAYLLKNYYDSLIVEFEE